MELWLVYEIPPQGRIASFIGFFELAEGSTKEWWEDKDLFVGFYLPFITAYTWHYQRLRGTIVI